ncbi:MAG: SMC-Scp complex subunit ScpB [Deltaproteobacteria bacterium]|nr:SMC-Scp complex subunit ScpB [Deltaproteobacteria bacterium]
MESLLLVSSDPIPIDKARQLLGGLARDQMRGVLSILRAKYPAETSGILVEEVAKGFQLRTNPANQEHVRKLFDVKPPRFSRAALETLAIIAYKQPLTRQEIEQIRGVDCAAPTGKSSRAGTSSPRAWPKRGRGGKRHPRPKRYYRRM